MSPNSASGVFGSRTERSRAGVCGGSGWLPNVAAKLEAQGAIASSDENAAIWEINVTVRIGIDIKSGEDRASKEACVGR